jgi:hypothetical protein
LRCGPAARCSSGAASRQGIPMQTSHSLTAPRTRPTRCRWLGTAQPGAIRRINQNPGPMARAIGTIGPGRIAR